MKTAPLMAVTLMAASLVGCSNSVARPSSPNTRTPPGTASSSPASRGPNYVVGDSIPATKFAADVDETMRSQTFVVTTLNAPEEAGITADCPNRTWMRSVPNGGDDAQFLYVAGSSWSRPDPRSDWQSDDPSQDSSSLRDPCAMAFYLLRASDLPKLVATVVATGDLGPRFSLKLASGKPHLDGDVTDIEVQLDPRGRISSVSGTALTTDPWNWTFANYGIPVTFPSHPATP